jgi:CheY-like chemotaxis protein
MPAVMKPRILFIDDDKNQFGFFLDALMLVPHDDGFKCTYASSIVQADVMFLAPDFIFADPHMPGMDGSEIIAFITSQPQLKNTKLCLYSTTINEQTDSLADDLGASCIKKSDSVNELAENLSALFIGDRKPDYNVVA